MRNRAAGVLALLFVLILPLNVFSGEGTKESSDAYFRIVRAGKGVRVRRNFSSVWEPAFRGMVLYRNDVVMNAENSELQIKTYKLPVSDQSPKELTLKRPFVARVDKDLLRTVDVSVYFRKSFENTVASAEGDMAFAEAWQQLSAQSFTEGLGLQTPRETTLAVAAKEIRIYAPFADQIFMAKRFPDSNRVRWDAPADYDGEYAVYFWPSEEARPKQPVDTTALTSYALRIDHFAAFNVQVTSVDGQYQSRIVNFSVESMDRYGERGKEAGTMRPLDLRHRYPPDHFVLQGDSSSVNFVWTDAEQGSHSYEVEIEDLANSSLRTFASGSGRLVRDLKASRYRWRVVDKEKGAASRWSELEVAGRPLQVQGLFQEYWKTGRSATVQLDDRFELRAP